MDIDLIVRQLRSRGFVVVEDALAPALRRRLDNGCADTVAFPFAAGGMGRGEDRTHDALVRGDVVSWLDDAKDADHAYLSVMEALRSRGELQFTGRLKSWHDPAVWQRTLDALRGTQWNVFAKGSVVGPESVLQYLNRRCGGVSSVQFPVFSTDRRRRLRRFSKEQMPHAGPSAG